MQVEKLKDFIFKKLEQELAPHLAYHNAAHTRSVFNHTKELAAAEKINGESRQLLLTAALLHDAGFLKAYDDHEEASCEIAADILPDFGYTHEQIEKVAEIIMATKLPQQPKSKLGEILCDADLYYIGTNRYTTTAQKLYHELQNKGIFHNKNEWTQKQVEFIKSHKFYTHTARQKLDKKKQENLRMLQTMKPVVKELKHDGFKPGDIMLIVSGVIIAGFALQGFLVPNNFFDGGLTGISLLIHEIYHFNLAYVIVLVNLPLIIMSRFSISIHFALKTLLCIILLGACLYYYPYILPHGVITRDNLLVSVFGGFFLGVGIGLTMRAGCAVDGIEVLALYTWRRTSFTISEIILALNIVIFSIAAIKFGVPTALYSILTYFTASRTVDYVVEGIEAYTGVTIISAKSEIIKDRLVNELGRGITVYKGERGFLPGKFEIHEECDIIFTVITRLELRKLKNLVNEVDHKAFVFASAIRETSGGVIKRRHMH
ncbi:MAG TPA: YitT family protein [Chitinophagaceae bacterium]|nr:YitT family protein [Chitinophagaceae bacterium]